MKNLKGYFVWLNKEKSEVKFIPYSENKPLSLTLFFVMPISKA